MLLSFSLTCQLFYSGSGYRLHGRGSLREQWRFQRLPTPTCETLGKIVEMILFFKKKWANPGLFLFIFVLFSLQFQYKLKKSIDGVLGIRTQGRRMVGADETTELWRPPYSEKIYTLQLFQQRCPLRSPSGSLLCYVICVVCESYAFFIKKCSST